MTDTIEAGKVAASIIGMPGTLLSQRAYDKLTAGIETYASARITAHTKALIEGAGEVPSLLDALASDCENTDGWQDASHTCRQAAATIAAMKAEIERLTERDAQAKLDGVRAGIEAARREAHKGFIQAQDSEFDTGVNYARDYIAGRIVMLDAAAIAKGE